MPYDPMQIKPMRDEMVMMGAEELLTPDEVAAFLDRVDGVALLFINSVCGCAAGAARPGLALSLEHTPSPKHIGTVFAGQDLDATALARSCFSQLEPSSPSLIVLKDGQVEAYVHRDGFEGRNPRAVSQSLIEIYEALIK
jgi:putative YphP/YqiW family bacilliredoxin